jgi:hypothetical protein
MDISEAIVANVVIILALGALVGLLATNWAAGVATTIWTFGISCWVWIAYVIIHFIQKFW